MLTEIIFWYMVCCRARPSALQRNRVIIEVGQGVRTAIGLLMVAVIVFGDILMRCTVHYTYKEKAILFCRTSLRTIYPTKHVPYTTCLFSQSSQSHEEKVYECR